VQERTLAAAAHRASVYEATHTTFLCRCTRSGFGIDRITISAPRGALHSRPVIDVRTAGNRDGVVALGARPRRQLADPHPFLRTRAITMMRQRRPRIAAGI
jgi:hypothetical protein